MTFVDSKHPTKMLLLITYMQFTNKSCSNSNMLTAADIFHGYPGGNANTMRCY